MQKSVTFFNKSVTEEVIMNIRAHALSEFFVRVYAWNGDHQAKQAIAN